MRAPGYRIIDEANVDAVSPPWDPRALFWISLLSNYVCPLAWIAGMACFIINWKRLRQTRPRMTAWSLLAVGIFFEINAFYFATVEGFRVAVDAFWIIPLLLLLHQLWSQLPPFAVYRLRSGMKANALPLIVGFGVSAFVWILVTGALHYRSL